MFVFNYTEGASILSVWGVWVIVFVALFGLNEVARRFKYIGLFLFCYFATNPFSSMVYSVKEIQHILIGFI